MTTSEGAGRPGGMTTDEPAAGGRPGLVARLRQRWTDLQAEHPAVHHAVAAYQRLGAHNGNLYAAAITFFSFVALFPLLLLVAAVTGFVLHAHPAAQASLLHHITSEVPGSVGTTLRSSIDGVIKARTGVGIVGLLGVLFTGLGWIGNLRSAVDAIWGRTPPTQNIVRQRVTNLVVLAGLGLALLVSLGLTAIGTSLTDQILSGLGLTDVFGMHWVLKIVGIAIAVAGDLGIFWWVLIRMPMMPVPRSIGLRGALMASVGFEVLKILGTYTIAKSAGSPTAGPFAGILAVLVWIQLVARWLLFCVAWIAVLTEERAAAEAVVSIEPPSRLPVATDEAPALSPATVGATLVGVGALAGATVTALAMRRGDQDSDSHRRR